MAYAFSSCFKYRARHLAELWARSPPRLACQRALPRGPEPTAVPGCAGCAVHAHDLRALGTASLLLASPTGAWRPDRRPCSASTLPCPAVAVVGRGPASMSPAAVLGTAPLTPLAVCALEHCLLLGLLGVASAVSLPGAIRRRAFPSLVVCCSARADGCLEHALRFPMARHGGTLR